MSTARELYLEAAPLLLARGDSAHAMLSRAAKLWREDGQHFSAGMAMLDAFRAAWGDPDVMLGALREAWGDFERVVAEESPSSPASIGALHKLRQSMVEARLLDIDRSSIATRFAQLSSELGQRLFKNFKDSEHADGYLVRGVVIVTDKDGTWSTSFPDYEVPSNVEQSGKELTLNIPSAFHLFVREAEWQAAFQIAQLREDAFTTPGLRGWRAVTLAHVIPAEMVSHFDEAADAFGTDVQPLDDEERARRGGSWSSANRDLWAKYFRARARLAESICTPESVRELLGEAARALAGTEAGWHSGEVSKFHVVIKVLSKLLSNPLSLNAEGASHEYRDEIRMSGETEQDRHALMFISEAANGFRGFATDPGSEITHNRLEIALEALAKVPTLGPEITDAVRPEIGKKALDTIYGPVHTWMHRSLEGITNEAQFRQVLLRLLQHGLPAYAQIRHGPLEYGKDISVLLDRDGVPVLRHYQVKCGDIDTPKWRESKDELEVMFQVPLTTFQIPLVPQQIEGVLVTNGHANTYIEPSIAGWLSEQRETHGRSVKIVHLDALVDWITKHHLVNELRVALREQGLDAGET